VVFCQQEAMENLFSAEWFLYQPGGSSQATEAGLQRVVHGLHDRYVDNSEALRIIKENCTPSLWPPSITQRPQETTHITDPQEACRKSGGNGHWARERWNQGVFFCWICGNVGVTSSECCQRAGNGQRSEPQRGEQGSHNATFPY